MNKQKEVQTIHPTEVHELLQASMQPVPTNRKHQREQDNKADDDNPTNIDEDIPAKRVRTVKDTVN